MYASQEILLGSSSGSPEPPATAGQGFGGDSAPSPGSSPLAAAAAEEDGDAETESDAGAPRKRTPAQRLLDEIMVTDADKWDGVLAGLSAPGSMTGGVTKEGLLGAIQASGVGGFRAGEWFGAGGFGGRGFLSHRRQCQLGGSRSAVVAAGEVHIPPPKSRIPHVVRACVGFARHACRCSSLWDCDVDRVRPLPKVVL